MLQTRGTVTSKEGGLIRRRCEGELDVSSPCVQFCLHIAVNRAYDPRVSLANLGYPGVNGGRDATKLKSKRKISRSQALRRRYGRVAHTTDT